MYDDLGYEMYPASAFQKEAGHTRLFKKDSKPPKPDPAIGQASKEMAAVARDQLQWEKEKYAEMQPYLEDAYDLGGQLLQQQYDIGEKSAAQADEYYNYMLGTFRPVERSLVDESMVDSAALQEEYANRAGADVQSQIGRQYDQIIRNAMRYGLTPQAAARQLGTAGISNASAVAGAMNQGREQAKQLSWAKRMDAAGLGRGLPGNQATSTGLALNAGNSAMGNAGAPLGLQMQMNQGYRQGVGTGLQGLQGSGQLMADVYRTRMQGWSAQQNQSDPFAQIVGMGVGAAINTWSDRRLKKDIVLIGQLDNGLNLYEFEYVWGGPRVTGVMADEVEKIMPEAVMEIGGYKAVNYDMVGV